MFVVPVELVENLNNKRPSQRRLLILPCCECSSKRRFEQFCGRDVLLDKTLPTAETVNCGHSLQSVSPNSIWSNFSSHMFVVAVRAFLLCSLSVANANSASLCAQNDCWCGSDMAKAKEECAANNTKLQCQVPTPLYFQTSSNQRVKDGILPFVPTSLCA
jgi:hypothetical protein